MHVIWPARHLYLVIRYMFRSYLQAVLRPTFSLILQWTIISLLMVTSILCTTKLIGTNCLTQFMNWQPVIRWFIRFSFFFFNLLNIFDISLNSIFDSCFLRILTINIDQKESSKSVAKKISCGNQTLNSITAGLICNITNYNYIKCVS